jgi:hypothetical protein
MHSVFHIKSILLLCFGLSIASYAQSDSTDYKIKHTLRKEYSKYFKFEVFKRGLDNKIITNRLDSLSNKPKIDWSRTDSLIFAQTNILARNYKLAQHYYSNLSIDPTQEFNQNIDQLCLGYLSKKYKESILKLDKDYPTIEHNSELYFFKKIFAFQDSTHQKSNWFKSNQSILTFNIDPNTKVNRKNNKEIVTPILNATSALKRLVFYVNDNDQIISRAFRDIGYTLENHISLTQAYIAYNIGRNYNKSDKQLIEDLKRIKAKLIKKNYTIPIFRRYFPKTKKGRFNYDILKEKIIKEQNDTIPKHIPNFESKNTNISLPFSIDFVVPVGFLVIFILLLLFLKTKKKK